MACTACQVAQKGSLPGRASDEWTRSYPLTDDGEFQVVAGGGSVDVQGGSKSTVDVRAERIAHAPTDAAAKEIVPRIQIREDVAPDKVVLTTQGLTGVVIGVEVEVNYHVTVPATARLRLRTANGAVSVSGMKGRVVMSSANGDLTGRNLSGGLDARTVNGKLTVDLASFGLDPVDLRTTNGRLDLAVPKDINATLSATAMNGKVDVKDIPFEALGDLNRRTTLGRLNGGGAQITINVVNGEVVVHPRP